MGNLGQTAYQTTATPVQNNSYMHVVIYTYTKGAWIVQPYFQYSNLPKNLKVGVPKATSATGGALNVSYAFKSGFSLPVRWEYLTSSGSATDGSLNLLGLDRAAQALRSPRRQPTKKEACTFAAISRGTRNRLHQRRCVWPEGNGPEPIPGRT